MPVFSGRCPAEIKLGELEGPESNDEPNQDEKLRERLTLANER
jgi:hypothetical protein